MVLKLRYTTFITQSLKEIHSGRETGLIDTGPLASMNTKQNDWWKTLKHLIKSEQSDVIPPLNKNGHRSTL